MGRLGLAPSRLIRKPRCDKEREVSCSLPHICVCTSGHVNLPPPPSPPPPPPYTRVHGHSAFRLLLPCFLFSLWFWICLEDVTSDDVILDVGCGDGRVLVTMAKILGCRGIGIDISQVCTYLQPAVFHAHGLTFFVRYVLPGTTYDRPRLQSALVTSTAVKIR